MFKRYGMASLLGTLLLLSACGNTIVDPIPEPDPFVPPAKPNAEYTMTFSFELPTFKRDNIMVDQAYEVVFKTGCLLQDKSSEQDLINPVNPQFGTVKLYYTTLTGESRKELGSADFANRKAAVSFTPTEAGEFLMKSEYVIDGTTYSATNFAAMKTAVQAKCKALIAADPQFAAISSQYNVATDFSSSVINSFAARVMFKQSVSEK
jgi:hypothetical protein